MSNEALERTVSDDGTETIAILMDVDGFMDAYVKVGRWIEVLVSHGMDSSASISVGKSFASVMLSPKSGKNFTKDEESVARQMSEMFDFKFEDTHNE